MTFEEARTRWPLLEDGARDAWTKMVARLVRTQEPCPVSSWRVRATEPQLGKPEMLEMIRRQTEVLGLGEQGPLPDESVEWRKVVKGAGGRRISLQGIWWFIREADKARRTGAEGQDLRERLGRRLWVACGIREAPRALPRRHGLSAWNEWRKGGALVISHLPRRVLRFGNVRRAMDLVEMEADLEAEEAELGVPVVQFDEGLRVDEEARLRDGEGSLMCGPEGLEY